MTKTTAERGSESALSASMERAKNAIFDRKPTENEGKTAHFVWWLEFEATEEDAYNLRDYARLLPSFSGRYYKRKGKI